MHSRYYFSKYIHWIEFIYYNYKLILKEMIFLQKKERLSLQADS